MILPTIGELNRKVTFHHIQTVTVEGSDIKHEETTTVCVWGKIEVIGGSNYWNSVAIDETVTHRIYIRYVPNRTRPQDLAHLTEVICEGVRYRVRRTTDVNGAHRFTMLECKEIGLEESDDGI